MLISGRFLQIIWNVTLTQKIFNLFSALRITQGSTVLTSAEESLTMISYLVEPKNVHLQDIWSEWWPHQLKENDQDKDNKKDKASSTIYSPYLSGGHHYILLRGTYTFHFWDISSESWGGMAWSTKRQQQRLRQRQRQRQRQMQRQSIFYDPQQRSSWVKTRCLVVSNFYPELHIISGTSSLPYLHTPQHIICSSFPYFWQLILW